MQQVQEIENIKKKRLNSNTYLNNIFNYIDIINIYLYYIEKGWKYVVAKK